MFCIKNLFIKLDNFELRVDELNLPHKGIIGLQGPSGSGKTSFLNVLIGLQNPVGWTWNFNDERMDLLEMNQRRFGVVFQGYDLFPHLTAEENVLLVMRARHAFAKKEWHQCVDELETLKIKLGLQSCWKTAAADLSGGERQRVALVRALVSNSRLLLLDEPFSALDNENKNKARQILKDVALNTDTPIILVTHDNADIEGLASVCLKIEDGYLIKVF